MKTKSQLLKWLQANLGKQCTAPLTSHDANALLASVALCPLISWSGAPPELFAAYAAIVRQMQPHTRHLAYHVIAAELDWGHRRMIWQCAGMENEIPTTRCQFE